MKAIVHVHQRKIKLGEPALIVRTRKGSKHYTNVEISGPSRLIQSSAPDHCGARVWIETDTKYLTCDGALYAEVKP